MAVKTLDELLEDRDDIKEEMRAWTAMRDYFADLADAAVKNNGATFATEGGEYDGTAAGGPGPKAFSAATLTSMFATAKEIIVELSEALEKLGSMTFEVGDYEEDSEETDGDSHEEED